MNNKDVVLGNYTANLAQCLAGVERHLAALFFQPPHEFAFPVARAALPLPAVAEITNGIAIQLLPGALRHAVRQRQVSFLAGRLCAEEALRIATGRPCVVGRDVSGMPLWPVGMVGSIAHTDDVACAVVAKQAGTFGIGIDIEPIVSDAARDDVAEVCMSGQEAQFSQFGESNTIATILFSANRVASRKLQGNTKNK
jgi:enterobactin synthetase component D